MRTTIAISALALLSAIAAPAAVFAQQSAQARVTEAELLTHVRELASDRFQGRRPGTEGETLTAHYIATQLAAAGWQPGQEGPQGWYAPVPLIELAPGESALAFTGANGADAQLGSEFALRAPGGEVALANMQAVFVGHGPAADGRLDGDIAGKVVLLLASERTGAMSGLRQRRDALIAAGARAVLTIGDVPAPWDALLRAYSSGQIQPAQSLSRLAADGLLSRAYGEALLAAGGIDAAAAREIAAQPGTVRALSGSMTLSARSSARAYNSYNVVARLPGRRSGGEAIVLTGHWDHLGECRPAGEADRICNGAVDNASGIAVLLETARRLGGGGTLDRDVWFVATTAEESGLLGAYYFAANPPMPSDAMRVVLNVDTVAIAPRGAPVAWIGRGNPVIDAHVEAAARALGRTLDTDTEADSFVRRQDGWAFTQAGIPAIMAGGSFSDMPLLQRFLQGSYHGPDDEVTESLELGGAADDADLHVLLVRRLASRSLTPAIPRTPQPSPATAPVAGPARTQ